MNQFPIDIAHIISDYSAIWTILPWVREIEYMRDEYRFTQSRDERRVYMIKILCRNPFACDELAQIDYEKLCFVNLSINNSEWAADLISSNYEKCCMELILKNTNPRVMALWMNSISQLHDDDKYEYCGNPNALELIKKYHPEYFNEPFILMNPSPEIPILARDQLSRELNKYQLNYLYLNSAPWAIEILKRGMYYNPAYFDSMVRNRHPYVVDQVINYLNDPSNLSVLKKCYIRRSINKNPMMINYLRAHRELINMDIYSNPAIFEPTPRPGILNILVELTW